MKHSVLAVAALPLALLAGASVAIAETSLSPMKIMQINDCLFMAVVDETMVGAQSGSPKRLAGDRILSDFYAKGCHTITVDEWAEFKRAPEQHVATYRAEARKYQDFFKMQRQKELAAKAQDSAAPGSN